ncbi:MAG TPA: hypothetical protein VN901_21400 [Candidatus Acidoferrales bacterium]|nr:hypothetical protein [Candidatus Acidoferrales bacterium]
MMTMRVATLGLLPAAISHDIGRDGWRPHREAFYQGGVVARLVGFWARRGDKLPTSEVGFIEEGEQVD